MNNFAITEGAGAAAVGEPGGKLQPDRGRSVFGRDGVMFDRGVRSADEIIKRDVGKQGWTNTAFTGIN